MKNNTKKSAIGYQGNVTLKICKGKKVVKTIKQNNSGVGRLFHGLALALINGFNVNTLDNYIPKYLGIGYKNPYPNTATDYNATTLESADGGVMLRVKLQPNNVYNVEGVGWVAPFSAIVTAAQLKALDYKVNELGLFSTVNTDTLLARIVPTGASEGGASEITIDEGMDLIVQWEILIQNNDKEIN